LIANRAPLFVLEPLIDTFAMVGMLTFLEFFHFVSFGKILEADAALIFLLSGVTQPVPCLFGEIFDLIWFEALADLTIIFFQL
jgi:hypothetical protein